MDDIHDNEPLIAKQRTADRWVATTSCDYSICFVATSAPMISILTDGENSAMGGSELQLSLLGQGLRSRGWEVTYLVGDYGQPATFTTAGGCSVLRAYAQSSSRTVTRTLFGSIPEFWRSLSRVDADVYLSRGLWGQSGVIAAFARRYRRKYVLWFARNWDAQYGVPRLSSQPLVERLPAWYGIHYAHGVVVQTNDQARLLRKVVGREGTVIPNIAPWQNNRAVDCEREHVLWIGSIRPVKRPHMFLDVAEKLPDVHFVMAGGEMKGHSYLYKAIRRRAAGLTNTDFLGFVPYSETPNLFEKALALVCTSEAEGFPNVFLQAWSTGTPVVATVNPDNIMSEYGLGYHCTSRLDMTQALQNIAGDEALRAQIGQRGREYVLRNHSEDWVINRVDEYLREVADG